MPAPDNIRQLVERFEQHRDAYRSGKYNETQLRRALFLMRKVILAPIESTSFPEETFIFWAY